MRLARVVLIGNYHGEDKCIEIRGLSRIDKDKKT